MGCHRGERAEVDDLHIELVSRVIDLVEPAAIWGWESGSCQRAVRRANDHLELWIGQVIWRLKHLISELQEDGFDGLRG